MYQLPKEIESLNVSCLGLSKDELDEWRRLKVYSLKQLVDYLQSDRNDVFYRVNPIDGSREKLKELIGSYGGRWRWPLSVGGYILDYIWVAVGSFVVLTLTEPGFSSERTVPIIGTVLMAMFTFDLGRLSEPQRTLTSSAIRFCLRSCISIVVGSLAILVVSTSFDIDPASPYSVVGLTALFLVAEVVRDLIRRWYLPKQFLRATEQAEAQVEKPSAESWTSKLKRHFERGGSVAKIVAYIGMVAPILAFLQDLVGLLQQAADFILTLFG